MSTFATHGTLRNVTGYVLAGGLSSRMGRDKAFLCLGGRELVDIAVHRLSEICAVVYLLSGRENFERDAILSCYAPPIPDRIEHTGPLGGVDAALHQAASGWCLFTAIDQPLLPSALLRQWTVAAIAGKAAASWMTLDGHRPGWNSSNPRVDRRTAGSDEHTPEAVEHVPQSLPLLLHTRVATAIHQQLQAGQRKLSHAIRAALASQQETYFEYPVPASPQRSHWFRNLNTPTDLRQAEVLLTAKASNQSTLAASE